MSSAAARLLAVVWLSAYGCTAADRTSSPGQALPSPVPTAEERLGIRVQAIRWSAGGTMLDFRYRVVDPEKAKAIMDRAIKPYLIDEASGMKFAIPSSPKIGPMRQTTRRSEAGRSYWMLFGNPARFVKPGNRVTVVVGDIRVEHLTVE